MYYVTLPQIILSLALVIALTSPDQSRTLVSQVSAPSVPTPTEEMRGSMEFGLGRKGINAGWNFARLG